ncbi:MAG: hypothetical protein M0R70_12560 [Nitrospirae bacterium]|nr:hypothetical protein [Nitrospirota bacterium]
MKEIKKKCPKIKAACWGEECEWFIHVRGKDPQSGADLDLKDCAMKWLPTLLIENSKETRQAAAAIESMRNEASVQSEQVALAICHILKVQGVKKITP